MAAMPSTSPEVTEFARRWAAEWNRLDIEAVLSHFHDEVVFSSPKARDTIGMPTVRGKEALRAYWRAALAGVTALRFDVVRVLWDADSSELAIVYDREVNGQRDRASEVLQFDGAGRITRGEVFYGVMP
jgi:ketosteroid isomerase-like protein